MLTVRLSIIKHLPSPSPFPSSSIREREREIDRWERRENTERRREETLLLLPSFLFFFCAWSIERCVSGIQVYLTEWPKTVCLLLKRSEHLDCRWAPHFLSTRNKYLMKLAISESETENSLSHQVLFPHARAHLVSQPPTAKRLFTAVVRKQSSSSTYEWLICL